MSSLPTFPVIFSELNKKNYYSQFKFMELKKNTEMFKVYYTDLIKLSFNFTTRRSF